MGAKYENVYRRVASVLSRAVIYKVMDDILDRVLQRVARRPSCSRNAHDQKDGRGTHVGPVLPERAVSEDPRWTRAVGDHASTASRKTMKECGPLMSAVKASPITPYEPSQEMDARGGDRRSRAGMTIRPLVVT